MAGIPALDRRVGNTREYALYQLALATGMRRGELLGLRGAISTRKPTRCERGSSGRRTGILPVERCEPVRCVRIRSKRGEPAPATKTTGGATRVVSAIFLTRTVGVDPPRKLA